MTSRVIADTSSSALCGTTTYEPECAAWSRPGSVDGNEVSISVALKPGPAGFVSPCRSRTRLSSTVGSGELTINRSSSPGETLQKSVYPIKMPAAMSRLLQPPLPADLPARQDALLRRAPLPVRDRPNIGGSHQPPVRFHEVLCAVDDRQRHRDRPRLRQTPLQEQPARVLGHLAALDPFQDRVDQLAIGWAQDLARRLRAPLDQAWPPAPTERLGTRMLVQGDQLGVLRRRHIQRDFLPHCLPNRSRGQHARLPPPGCTG